MRIIPSAFPEVLVLEPDVYADNRGSLVVSFHEGQFADAGLPSRFAQDNHSRSLPGVVRGLHYQLQYPQGKLITVIRGEIFDVAVDIRVGSPTFGKWVSETLRGDTPRYLWIPPGFAHGFAVLTEADILYKCTVPYEAADQHGIRWDDPEIGIPWPIANPVLSATDRTHLRLADAGDALPRFGT